jgi:drug/metabolite transporter (DMT)-like permease
MLALSLGLAAALIWAVHDLLARKLTQGAALLPIILVVLGSGCWVLLGPALVFGDWADLSRNSVRLAIAGGCAFALASGTLFRAFSMAPARIVAPIIGAYPMLSLGSAVLQGRPVTQWDWLAVVAVVFGIAVVSMTIAEDEKTKAPFAAMGWAALSACGFAATFAIGQEAARQGSELPVILITRLTAVTIIAALFLAQRSSLQSIRGNWVVISFMGLFDAVALSLVTISGSLPFAEYATIASSLFGVVTIILASYFLGEKLRPLQWLGVAIVFGAIGFLSAQG